MSETETFQVLESTKQSKLDRIKANAIMGGIFVIPVAMSAGAMYVSTKNARMALETARLNLEAARLNAKS